MVTPAVKREAVAHLRTEHEMSERRACRVIGCQRMMVRYRSRRPDDPVLRERLRALARERRRFGYRRLLIFLRRGGFIVNHKRLFRIYREERLMVRKRGGRKRALGTRAPMPVPLIPNDRWSLDFVSDQLASGRRFRILAIFDDCTRECLAAVADVSLSGRRVVRELDLLIATRGRPRTIVSDNGTELTSNAILCWVGQTDVGWHYIAPGRVPERDAVHLPAAGAPCPGRLATRLQQCQATLAHRLAGAGRLRRPILTRARPRRCAPQGLRVLANDRNCARWQPPDSQCNWIRVGGNVSLPTDFCRAAAPSMVVARVSYASFRLEQGATPHLRKDLTTMYWLGTGSHQGADVI
jgi:transposase InsO family protein